ncbi:TIGR03749 family integrating conjugative element protein, partial [Serratia ficaria]|uniref:TIGR03749 family integrating conjugative element protein n=1 Tax=Serratia ficaria TaxID=61651 RepID=UPI0021C75AFF
MTMGLPTTVQALEILRWERLPLTVSLYVDQERVVFIDRNVRVGVPASLSDRLRVQSAGGAIYLRASEPIKPTRLQLQDADSGALILLDPPCQDSCRLELKNFRGPETTKMNTYSPERKAALIARMMPPHNQSVVQLA